MRIWGNSLAVQGLGLHASTAGSRGQIPGQGIKIPHATQHGQKKENENFFLFLSNIYTFLFFLAQQYLLMLNSCSDSTVFVHFPQVSLSNISNLHKSCKNSTMNTHIPVTEIHQSLIFRHTCPWLLDGLEPSESKLQTS